jgi:hypothetical protein
MLTPLLLFRLAANVSLMVDAEQTYLQPAIDHCVLHLQRKYDSSLAAVFAPREYTYSISHHH